MADTKGTNLNPNSTPTEDDLVIGVNAPGGTPETQKSTWRQVSDAGFGTSFTPAPASDLTVSGVKVTLTAGEALVFGDVCYIKSDGKMGKADADAIATSSAVAIAIATIANNADGLFLMLGFLRNDGYTWTVGGLLYLSTTAGGITQTAPSGVDDVIQVLGVATHADRIYFNPQLVQVEHT